YSSHRERNRPMDQVYLHDVAALGSLKNLSAAASATAGGTGNATATTGHCIDRFGFLGGIAGCAAFALLWEATLATGATLTLAYVVQESPDGTIWSEYASGSSVVATGNAAGSAQYGAFEIGVDLHSAGRYVRLNSTPTLSASATDTANTQATGFFAGFDRLPQ
ncbi:MAG: hypothetical protein WCD42_01630, partial [Rhizomicrobium sp.]